MFPINRQTRIKTSRLPTVTKCDTRFRNNAKFASFDVLYSQREFRVVPKKLSTVSLRGGKSCSAGVCRRGERERFLLHDLFPIQILSSIISVVRIGKIKSSKMYILYIFYSADLLKIYICI